MINALLECIIISMDHNREPSAVSITSCLSVLIIGMMIFVGLFLYFAIRGTNLAGMDEGAERSLLTVIPAPTLTPTVYATKVPQTLDIHYVSEDGLSVGMTVAVYDTGDTGLSVRPQPGLGGYLNFVAYEGERFVIVDGPDSRNDYIWWKLESPDDPDRTGWAVSDYLKAVE